MAIDKTFGINVKKYRKARELTQQELADLVGLKSGSSINKIELAQRDVPKPLIVKLSNALGVEIMDLFGKTEDPLADEFMPLLHKADETTLNIIRTILKAYISSEKTEPGDYMKKVN